MVHRNLKLIDFHIKLNQQCITSQNIEMKNLQKDLEEIKVQFGKRNEDASSLKRQVTAMEKKVEKEVKKVLATAVEEGLRDLPFEMVCAFQGDF